MFGTQGNKQLIRQEIPPQNNREKSRLERGR